MQHSFVGWCIHDIFTIEEHGQNSLLHTQALLRISVKSVLRSIQHMGKHLNDYVLIWRLANSIAQRLNRRNLTFTQLILQHANVVPL